MTRTNKTFTAILICATCLPSVFSGCKENNSDSELPAGHDVYYSYVWNTQEYAVHVNAATGQGKSGSKWFTEAQLDGPIVIERKREGFYGMPPFFSYGKYENGGWTYWMPNGQRLEKNHVYFLDHDNSMYDHATLIASIRPRRPRISGKWSENPVGTMLLMDVLFNQGIARMVDEFSEQEMKKKEGTKTGHGKENNRPSHPKLHHGSPLFSPVPRPEQKPSNPKGVR